MGSKEHGPDTKGYTGLTDGNYAWVNYPCICGDDKCNWVGSTTLTQYVFAEVEKMEYELYVEKVQITQWRDDSVYGTISLGTNWYPENVVKANIPRQTWVMYIAANDEFAQNNM